MGEGGRGELRPQSAKVTASKDPTSTGRHLCLSPGSGFYRKQELSGTRRATSWASATLRPCLCFAAFFFFPEKSLVLNGKISYYSSVKVRQ